MKKSVILIIALMLLISIPITGYAYYQFLGVPIYKQQNIQDGIGTCWACATAMVVSYNTGKGDMEVQICTDIYGSYPHTGYNTNDDVIYELRKYTNYDDTKINNYDPLSLTAINYQCSQLAPPIAHIDENPGMHDVVVRGLDDQSEIFYNDPWDGTEHTQLYSFFKGAVGTHWHWYDTVIES